MATTDAKTGFRLPWSADRNADAPSAASTDATTPTDDPTVQPEPSAVLDQPDAPGAIPPEETESPAMIDAAPAATTTEAAVDAAGAAPASDPTPAAPAPASPSVTPARRPNKFMADLTKAMQSAAESARADTLERLGADAKSHIEAIHADSATEATELRKQADDDVAAVREWSKAEIARIREETDERITHRKERLEREIEAHAAEIEARIERVQARVAAFETEMASFFERLLAEDDPTRFAAMAESLPEPPPFDRDEPLAVVDAPTVDVVTPTEPETMAEAQPAVEATTGWETEPVADVEPSAEAHAEPAWPAAEIEMAAPTTPVETDAGDLFSIGADVPTETAEDPRLSALGLGPDFAAAEAEAASFTAEPTDDGSDEPVAEIGDDTIAARLAGLVPDGEAGADSAATTTLVVTGLVSVASIAGFKRHLSRAEGVKSVGVSSGPEGEFVYLVSHDPAIALRDVVAALPGFAARVTAETDAGLTVVAQDPESGN